MTNHHRIDYIELGATDMAASKAFYAAAFGWPFTDYGPDYASFDDGRLSGGVTTHPERLPCGCRGLSGAKATRDGHGLRPAGSDHGTRENPVPTGPLVVLFSDDLEATRDAVTDAGGAIVKEIFSFPGGRRFEFTDPAGNTLAVWGHDPAQGAS